MARRGVRLARLDAASAAGLAAVFDRVRAELEVPAGFPADVLAEARHAAAAPMPPEGDLTGVPFVTVDPPGSTDLDQAMHLARRADGYRVQYAIADVPWFVAPDGSVAAEALRRGQTLYAPDRRVPLHPEVLSEGAASLLEGQVRPAFVWRFDVDSAGEVEATDLVRALVRSRRRLDYGQVQRAADAHPDGAAPPGGDDVAEQAVLLRAVGRLRTALERARGGASLSMPEQEVHAEGGVYRLQMRPPVPAEDWNAQLSLMTGMAAARLMLDAGVGLLRTMPPPDDGLLDRFRRQATALGVAWRAGTSYGELLAGLDRTRPAHLALLHAASGLFRGAGYTPVGSAPAGQMTHAALAAPYAHVTAPLRRLVDRFGLVICHAAASGAEPPEWARGGLSALPEVMRTSDSLAGRLERRCLDAVEAAVLRDRVGDRFDAVVVDLNHSGGLVQVLDPAVMAACRGPLRLGERVQVRLAEVDVAAGRVLFDAAPAGPLDVRPLR